MNKQNEATWLKILEKKENHYKLREKLVIDEVKKEIIEKIEGMKEMEWTKAGENNRPQSLVVKKRSKVNRALQDIINLLTLNK